MKKQSLNYSWRFLPGFEAAYAEALPRYAQQVDLPHTVESLPYHYFSETAYQGIYTYEKRFDDDCPEWKEKVLHFDGAMLQFDAYLNGKHLGHFVSGYFPVDIDVSDSLLPKGNRLLVILDTREDPLIPPFGHIVDYLTFGGLYRGVYLYAYPENRIGSLFVEAEKNGTIHVESEIVHPVEYYKLRHVLTDLDGNELLRFDTSSARYKEAKPWSIESPNLYLLHSYYGEDEVITRIGFRDVAFKNNGFYLNGKKTKIIGVNRHQTYPYFGAAAPKSLQEDDARTIKVELGANLVRTSHYADAEEFLDCCDELGLLLVDEIPGWQHIDPNPAWRNQLCDFAARLIKKERNHPCLIAYGLRVDESQDDHDLYAKIQEIKAELDPHRPSLGVRNFKNSELLEDIYAYNDFSCESTSHGLDDSKTFHKGACPTLVSENMGHTYPAKTYDTPARLLEHALRHARVLDDSFKDPNLSGSVAWCAFDYNTHKDFGAFDHICYHGLSDIFRLPKPAAYLYASQRLSNIFYVATRMDPGDEDSGLLPIGYVFSDCEEVALYRNGIYIQSFVPDEKDFPNMPHPPFKIDDYFGEALKKERFSAEDAEKMAPALNRYAHFGGKGLRTKDKLLLARIMRKYKMSFDDVIELFTSYIYPRGKDSGVWEFVGYKGGKAVARKKIGASEHFHYALFPSKTHLVNEDTYDAMRIAVTKRDEFETLMPYGDDSFIVETSGPIRLLSPKIAHLVGGGISIYVASEKVDHPQSAKVTIYFESEKLEVELYVE